MVVLINTGLPQISFEAIRVGVEQKKWKSPYQFLQEAATEKLQREGLINFDNITFVHYICSGCGRHIYVLPELSGLKEWFYCIKCYPNGGATKDKALLRNGISIGKDIPKDAEIRRF